MKRTTAIILALVLLLSCVPMQSFATGSYGKVPIYTGYTDVDYLADQILKEIPTEGKDDRGKIQAVYDWIITHCKRMNDNAGWNGPDYFDESEVPAKAEAYINEHMQPLLDAGEAVFRPEWETIFAEEGYLPASDDGYMVLYDSNYYQASFAYTMMLKREGNCAHFSSLLALLLGHLGFDCRLIDGYFLNNNGSRVMHKWNYVLLDGEYYWLDVRMDHASYTRAGAVPHNYFLVKSTATWAKSHAWDHSYSDQLAKRTSFIRKMYNKLLIPAEPSVVGNFIDVPKSEYYGDAVAWAVENGVTSGASKYSFQPDSTCTRAQVVTFLWRAKGCPEPEALKEECRGDQRSPAGEQCSPLQVMRSGNPFTDVKEGEYYYKAVLWAVEKEITTGTGEGKFSPNKGCTRGQVVTFLWRTEGKPGAEQDPVELPPVPVEGEGPAEGGEQETGSPFTDVDPAKYYYDAVLWAVQNGITTGTGEGKFSPEATCTRGQIVTFLYRAVAPAA